MFQVIDNHTKRVVATYSSFNRAWKKADKLDMIYGACRYQVKKV